MPIDSARQYELLQRKASLEYEMQKAKMEDQFSAGVEAKCPQCGKITRLWLCHTCRTIFCVECLSEHAVTIKLMGEWDNHPVWRKDAEAEIPEIIGKAIAGAITGATKYAQAQSIKF